MVESKKINNISTNGVWTYVLLGLLVLYTLKGALYPTGIISMTIAAIELGICFVFGLLSLKYKSRNNVIDCLFLIIVIISLSFIISEKVIFSSILGKVSTFTFFREFCGAVFPALGMYYIARRGKITLKLLTLFFYTIFLTGIVAFFYETVTTMVDLTKEEITSNASYRFVYIMPFVVFLKSRFKALLFWVIAISIAIISAKRGAILGIGLECMAYYWWDFKASRHKTFYLVGVLLMCLIGWHYLYDYYQNDVYIQMRVEDTLEGKTSGRDIILSKLLDHYGNAGLMEIIKGAGFVKTLKIAGNYAHNDWFEILIDCGVIGVICYLMFYIALLINIKYSRSSYKRCLWLIFISFLPSSFYSMVFFSEGSSIAFLWLGFILGRKDFFKYSHRLARSNRILPDLSK